MKKSEAKEALSQIRALTDAGRLTEAHAALGDLRSDPDALVLGQMTVLDQPRQLQAAALRLAKREGDAVTRAGLQFHLVPKPDILARHAVFGTAERRDMVAANRTAVPPLLHQIWIGPKPAPVTSAAWAAHAARHGLSYRLWREADLRELGVQDNAVFAAMLARGDYPGAVDVARYILLARLGGIYLDCDWYPARSDISFADRLPLLGLTAFAEDIARLTGQGSVLLANSFIATPPAHPVMARMVQALPVALADLPDVPAWWSTGPLLFTVVARGGSVTLADAALIAGQAHSAATEAQVADHCADIQRKDGGLLLVWKPW